MNKNTDPIDAKARRPAGRRRRLKSGCLYALTGALALIVVAAGLLIVRRVVASAEIDREWQAQLPAAPNLQPTNELEILPVYDNDEGSTALVPGFGVSYLIRTDAATVLMDLGNNEGEAAEPPAIANLASLAIAPADIDAVVISHPHPDHVGGTAAWQGHTISPGSYATGLRQKTIIVPVPMSYQGTELTYAPKPILVASDIATTGSISYPEVFPLSLLNTQGHEEALVVSVKGKGLVLVTGCGHPTLERLVSRAEALFGQQVVGVVGGLHYQGAGSEALQQHIEFLKARSIGLIAISPHDTSAPALAAFQAAFPDSYRPIRIGEAIKFP